MNRRPYAPARMFLILAMRQMSLPIVNGGFRGGIMVTIWGREAIMAGLQSSVSYASGS